MKQGQSPIILGLGKRNTGPALLHSPTSAKLFWGVVQNTMNEEQDPVAQKRQVLLIDDLTGEDAQETVKLALDGAQYEIDLTADHAAELRGKLEPYLSSARRLRGGSTGRAAKRETAPRSGESRKIREWAVANGFQPSARGRISQEIREAYSSAQK